MTTRFTVLQSVQIPVEDGDFLCLQKVICIEQYGEQTIYRFIRKGKDGRLKPQRGGAVIFDLSEVARLLSLMEFGKDSKSVGPAESRPAKNRPLKK